MRSENLCGISCYHPSWLQRFANSKAFLVVYGLLGTTQAMAYLYFIVTLTTLEKRFKIPSQTTGKNPISLKENIIQNKFHDKLYL